MNKEKNNKLTNKRKMKRKGKIRRREKVIMFGKEFLFKIIIFSGFLRKLEDY